MRDPNYGDNWPKSTYKQPTKWFACYAHAAVQDGTQNTQGAPRSSGRCCTCLGWERGGLAGYHWSPGEPDHLPICWVCGGRLEDTGRRADPVTDHASHKVVPGLTLHTNTFHYWRIMCIKSAIALLSQNSAFVQGKTWTPWWCLSMRLRRTTSPRKPYWELFKTGSAGTIYAFLASQRAQRANAF